MWLLNEYDGNIYLFVRIWEPTDSGDINDLLNTGKVAAFAFSQSWPRRGKVGRKNIVLENVYDLPVPKVEPKDPVTE
ncbi:hypothetical protein D3C80_1819000 [compost metagenome]